MEPSTLIASFFDHYLQLDDQEEEQFRDEFSKIPPKEQEEMSQFTTSWHEKGLVQGLEQGRQEGLFEGRLRTAKRMLSLGFAREQIQQATEFSKSE